MLPQLQKAENKTRAMIQPKLTVNAPGDIYEQEADAMAERVMRMPANENQLKPTTGLIGASIQRKCADCEEEEKERQVMRKTDSNAGMQVSPSFVSSLNSSRGSGNPLPNETKGFMENAFSADFSQVRLHTGKQASEMSHGINARAFTVGSDIYFGNGQYSPESNSGKNLLAHELTHVVQQTQKQNLQIQRDYAVDLPNPDAVAAELTEEQIQDAIHFNTRRFRLNDAWEISLIRDVLGLSPEPAEVDADLVNALAQFQAENNITPDGKLGAVTSARLSRELYHEGETLTGDAGRELLRASRRMGTRAMRISILIPAHTIGNLGEAEYRVMWHVPDTSANGFIIQHLTVTGNIQDCAGTAVPMVGFEGARDYWEAWRVTNGVVMRGTLPERSVRGDTFHTASQNAGTRGTVRERGQVSYFPDYFFGNSWITGVAHPAGVLPHRDTRPSFWNEAETMRHEMTVTHNDCTTPATATVTSTPN